MKNLISILFFCLLISQTIIPQWYQQNSGTGETLRSVTFLDVNIGTVVGNDGIIKKTFNGGVTWSPQSSGTAEVLEDVCFTNIITGIAVGWSGTILRTTDGGTNWISQTSGTSKKLNRVSFVDSNYGWIVGDNIILRTTDGGTLWTTLSDSGLFYGVAFIDTSIGWIVGENGKIFRTTDGGENWMSQLSGISEWLSAVCFIDENNGIICGDNGIILRTTNAGANWTQQTSGTTNILFNLCFIDENNGTICGENGTLLRTTNAGTNWSQQAGGTTEILYGICFSDLNNGTTVGTGGIILRTNNGGFTPTINVLYPNGGEYWVNGTTEAIVWTSEYMENVRIELSIDNSTSWNTIVDSMASTGIYTWTVNSPTSSDECLIRISDLSLPDYYDESDSVFTIDFPQSVKNIDIDGVPREFVLSQNYPNPFNPNTTINYALPHSCEVTITLYDILGNEVSTLVSENKKAGYYSVEFNASNLSSGIYFYKIEAVDPSTSSGLSFVEVNKMVLLK